MRNLLQTSVDDDRARIGRIPEPSRAVVSRNMRGSGEINGGSITPTDDDDETGQVELSPLVPQQQPLLPPLQQQQREDDHQLTTPPIRATTTATALNQPAKAVCEPCRICNIIKPARAKHCYTCGRCVRRFDHHCPYLGQCVGEGNHGVFWAMLVMHLSLAIVCAVELFPLLEGQATFTQMLSRNWLVSLLQLVYQ